MLENRQAGSLIPDRRSLSEIAANRVACVHPMG
jgi:hypothetical protein